MPKCAGCNTYLLTKEIYCKACKKKIADGLLTPVEDAPASEEEIARRKLVAKLVRKNEREEDKRYAEERQKWKISGYVETLQAQMYSIRDSLKMNDEITSSKYSQCVLDDFYRRFPFLKFAVYCNEKYFLVSNTKMVSISKLGINERIAKDVEEIISPRVSKTVLLRDLDCYTLLPSINVDWSDWLVFSTLLKWSSKLSVRLSSYGEKKAAPLVAPKGLLDFSDLVIDGRQRKYFVPDDLEDLDRLLEPVIEWKDIQG